MYLNLLKYSFVFVFLFIDVNTQVCEEHKFMRKMQETYKVSKLVTYIGQCFTHGRIYVCMLSRWKVEVKKRIVPRSGYVLVKKCCDGYRLQDKSSEYSNTTCKPICDPDCENGYCKYPGQCECYHGYAIGEKNNHTCVRTREMNTTTDLNSTVASSPWESQTTENYATRMNCDINPCGNGICLSPKYCRCYDGYDVDFLRLWGYGDGPICVPFCFDCDRTKCVAPNKCVGEETTSDMTTTTAWNPTVESFEWDSGTKINSTVESSKWDTELTKNYSTVESSEWDFEPAKSYSTVGSSKWDSEPAKNHSTVESSKWDSELTKNYSIVESSELNSEPAKNYSTVGSSKWDPEPAKNHSTVERSKWHSELPKNNSTVPSSEWNSGTAKINSTVRRSEWDSGMNCTGDSCEWESELAKNNSTVASSEWNFGITKTNFTVASSRLEPGAKTSRQDGCHEFQNCNKTISKNTTVTETKANITTTVEKSWIHPKISILISLILPKCWTYNVTCSTECN